MLVDVILTEHLKTCKKANATESKVLSPMKLDVNFTPSAKQISGS